MEITGDPYGKDKEGVISFYVVYNGEDNHETFKSLVEQFNLNDLLYEKILFFIVLVSTNLVKFRSVPFFS